MTQFKYGTPYNDYLAAHVAPVDAMERRNETGGYFAKPNPTQDPRIVDPVTQLVRADVRQTIMHLLYTFWNRLYVDPMSWSTPWIAGSSLAYQWEGRADADLDVLIGIDYPKFYADNPAYRNIPESDLADWFNDEFRNGLSNHTNAYNIDGTVWEITFYVNPGGSDIRNISPYAAFNLKDNTWTVPAVQVGADWDPRSHFPQQWWQELDTDVANAQAIITQYDEAIQQLQSLPNNDPRGFNALANLEAAAQRATSMFDTIHEGRKESFKPGGQGYYGFGNLRWQVHKKNGTANALHAIKALTVEARKAQQLELYGAPIEGPHQLEVKAALHAAGVDWMRAHL